jgi:hypothetical protein
LLLLLLLLSSAVQGTQKKCKQTGLGQRNKETLQQHPYLCIVRIATLMAPSASGASAPPRSSPMLAVP